MSTIVFDCRTCGRSFGSKQALQQHESNSPAHTKALEYKTCSEPFSDQTALREHQQMHQPNPPFGAVTFDCGTCGRSFGSKKAAHQHQKDTHHELTCETRSKSPKTQKALDQHCQNSPVHAVAFGCKTCERAFLRMESLQQHERDSHPTTHDCGVCHRSFLSEAALNQHERDLHRAKYDCKSCDRSFSTEGALQQHERDSPAHQATFGCKHCNRSFSTRGALQQHERDSPAHQATFGEASQHYKRGSPAQETTFDREISHRSTPSEDGPPANPSTFGCEECDRSFFSKDAMQQHERDSPAHASVRSWSMHLSLHDEVLQLIAPDGLSVTFFEAGGFEDCTRDYDTHIMGHFTCTNRACRTDRWSSKKIAITIRLYRGERYNAVVWHQRCKRCDTCGKPTLDYTYAERIAYRLRVWSGIRVESRGLYHRNVGPPHQKALCEGCKAGHCKDGIESEDGM